MSAPTFWREHLGPEFDADLREMRALLASRPAQLRRMLINAPHPVLAQELAVLRAYLRGRPSGLDARLRNGALDEADRAMVACLLAALARLPVQHGAVFHHIPRAEVAPETFSPGRLLVSPGFIRSSRCPASDAAANPAVRCAIWSRNARQTWLLDDGQGSVLFPPGTRFRVLDVAPADRGRDVTVFLTEVADRAGRDVRILEHLRRQCSWTGVSARP